VTSAPKAQIQADGLPGFVSVASMSDAIDLAPMRDSEALLLQDLDVTAAGIARSLVSSSRRIIGLLPAGKKIDPLVLAEEVGSAIVVLSDCNAVVIDPERRSLPSNEARGVAGFVASARGQGVVAIAPQHVHPPGAKAEGVKALLDFARQRADGWRIAFIDLTGCALPGEVLDVLPLMDGILVVGRAQKVTEKQVRIACSRVPEDLFLGVALVD
jgi:hypothetical protein